LTVAALYEDRGDARAAVRHYARLVELWQDADPLLQPRVQAAVRALQRLQPDGRPAAR
jgi:hypothetical protein